MVSTTLIQALTRKGYTVSVFATSGQAVAYLTSQIHGCSVGFGDSLTLATLGLADCLAQTNEVFDPGRCAENEFIQESIRALTTDVFLTSVNGVSETGELVNLDGTGNRIAGSLFGHRKVYFIFGTNKIEPTLDKAIWRARNIAAPQNARRLALNTPCAILGDRCYDCQSLDRICNAMTIYFQKMDSVESEIIIIEEKLGY